MLLAILLIITGCNSQCLRPIETSIYGNSDVSIFMQKDYRNQGKIEGISSWGTWKSQQNLPYTIGNLSWYSNNVESGTIISDGMSTFDSCPSFTLESDDYIHAVRVIYNGQYIYGLYFYTHKNNVYQCIHNNININLYSDSGIIYHDNYYLSGFRFWSGSIIDAISFQFTPATNYCTCCQCIGSKLNKGCTESTGICEDTICSIYPFCCIDRWSDICSNIAENQCNGNSFNTRSPSLSSEWQLIARLKNISDGTYSSSLIDDGNENVDDIEANTYSIIGEIGDEIESSISPQVYQDEYGRYEFKLIYYNFDNTQYVIEFKQSSWIETTVIRGYVPINIPSQSVSGCEMFKGLGLSDYSGDSYIDGNALDNCWWNSLGTLSKHNNGIPGFNGKLAYYSALYILKYQQPSHSPSEAPTYPTNHPTQPPTIHSTQFPSIPPSQLLSTHPKTSTVTSSITTTSEEISASIAASTAMSTSMIPRTVTGHPIGTRDTVTSQHITEITTNTDTSNVKETATDSPITTESPSIIIDGMIIATKNTKTTESKDKSTWKPETSDDGQNLSEQQSNDDKGNKILIIIFGGMGVFIGCCLVLFCCMIWFNLRQKRFDDVLSIQSVKSRSSANGTMSELRPSSPSLYRIDTKLDALSVKKRSDDVVYVKDEYDESENKMHHAVNTCDLNLENEGIAAIHIDTDTIIIFEKGPGSIDDAKIMNQTSIDGEDDKTAGR